MSFSLTKYRQYGLDTQGVSRRRGIQRVELHITGLTTDVDLDIGDDSGTFWTAALADGTYGDLATSALADIQRVVERADTLLSVAIDSLIDRVQAASASGAAYAVALENTRPNITMAASNGETSYVIALDYLLDVDQLPHAVEYGG